MTLSPSDFIALGTLAVSVLVPTMGYVRRRTRLIALAVEKVRTNDMHHLDEKVDRIEDGVARIQDRFDRHLEAHAAAAIASK